MDQLLALFYRFAIYMLEFGKMVLFMYKTKICSYHGNLALQVHTCAKSVNHPPIDKSRNFLALVCNAPKQHLP